MHKDDLNEDLAELYSRVSLECKSYLESDSLVSREDTCRGLLALLEQLRSVLTTVNAMKTEERARHYHITYNAISYILDISEYLRKTNFSFEIIAILAEAIKAMEENVILCDVKYLDRRTELYLKVAKIYEEWENYQQAVALLDNAVKSYKNLKSLHEQDPPVPQYISAILSNNLKLIKVFQIKYSIQAGSLAPADWKKKIEEQFGEDTEIKLMCLIECLKTQTKKHSNIFAKNLKNFKEVLLQAGFQMVRPFLETLSKGLSQQKQKIERQVTFKSNANATQQDINEEIKKKREVEEKFIRESELRKASEACPLEYHAQLIHYALQMKSSKIIAELLQYAQIRVQCRRIEVPYINDVMITVSNSPFPNVPNGYSKIPIDLNEANLIKQLTKLRKSGKKPPEEQQVKQVQPPQGTVPPAKEDKKDSKKAGKQPPGQPPPVKDSEASKEPSEWELNQIKHKYVFMMVKKSMSPEGALYNLGVVMGNEEKGPIGYNDHRRIIVPYIQQNMKVMESQIKQHTGVRETTGLVPYIILYHSRDELQNEEEKKTVIVDVAPLIGKNPMVPAKWGYKKIDVDLRQVPSEFIKAPNHDYVYLTYKTDELFHISERHIQIIKAFVELENTWNQKKGGNNEDQKWMELEINYDVEKLNIFFETVQEALKGDLGQQYYRHRCDFLTSLTFEIWKKYLKNALLQLDYMREQRLNGEIIDYDYEFYKSILEKCSSVFLRGLKVMNIVMVNNPKGDTLLSAKISLELAKLLEENKLYKIAADNIRLCLDNLRKFRDQYLSKGVEGASDKLLPFSVTCSNSQIKRVITEMTSNYHKQRRTIEKALRIKERISTGQKKLSSEELEEEEKEYLRFRKADRFDEVIERLGTSHSHVYSIVSALELDLLNLYFRISLKRSEELTIYEQSKNEMTNGIKNSELQGLASTLHKKLTLNQGPTQTKNIQNLSQLQNTLVKANQLPPPRPKLQKMQAKLMAENKKNPYNMVLLMLNLAAQNSDNKDKRYYLEESLRYLNQCIQLQAQMMSKAIDNAIFIFSGLWDNKIVEKENSEKISPFLNLYSDAWQKETDSPEPPILITKNSTSVHLKLPPFIPARKNQKEEPKRVKFMSIYGKPSANGVDVSLNCTELTGTGVRKEIGKTVKVSSLIPNNLYCFAAAGIDNNQDMMGIGKTGEDIGTFNPFSIPMLASYLAKISYQINEYQIAEKATAIVIKQYCNQSKYLSRDERVNNLSFYILNQQQIKGVSLLEIKSVSEAFYIAALCQRRNLNQIKINFSADKSKVIIEEKERLITNLLMLSGCLAPSLSSPNMSIPFLIPESEVLQRAIIISMIPDKWMNPKIRRLGSSVMSKLLKWGLQNNEVSLARRLVYKWNERKFLVLGKMIQVEEKKQIKKGAKDSKDQQVKLIDKYCRLMIEKSPYLMDAFEDSLVTVSEEYYDYLSLFIERAKEQIANLSQYVDNPAEELEAMTNHLNFKVELAEYLKEPLQSIKKVGNTSPYYFQYNSKILKKALQLASEADYKVLLQKSEELDVPEASEEIKIAKEIYNLIFSAIKEDIGWTPSSKLELIEFQKNTGRDLSKAISIFSAWENKKTELSNRLKKLTHLKNRFKDFDYLNIWISELQHLKAQCQVIAGCNDFEVKRKIKIRYDKIKMMNIDDLFKKEKEVLVLEENTYTYTQEQLKKLTQILNLLSQSIYSALLVQNWLKLQSTIKFLCNFLAYIEITPFYHKKSPIWTYFAFISLCAIEMLNKIRRRGFWEFKERYNKKLTNTELANISEKLQIQKQADQSLIQEFVAQYYQPDLESSTTKSFWFMQQQNIDIEPISSLIAYTVNTLRLENKHQLVINIVRDFCNVTQHHFSLMLLPFMTSSQAKLLEDVQKMIQRENEEFFQVTNAFNAEKQKMGKKRAYLMSGEKMPFEKQYEEKSQRIKDSLKFLNNQKNYIESQMNKSNRIKDEITRDTSKQVLAQEEQRKYTNQFGQHYQQMYRQYGEEAKHVKKSKNFIKDIINKYDSIYEQLKNSKTTKDPLAEIQNRNDVGNLWFASSNLDKAYEFWNDSLATIFKKVNPIENYHQILTENKSFLAKTVGEKQVVLAICLLYKIANFTCGHRLQLQKAATHFVCHLVYSLFQSSLQYPQTYLMYKDCRIKSFPAPQIFADENTINLSQLLSALDYFILRNLYEENALSALPLASFYQYLSTDVVKHSETSIKAKIYKALLLSESGLIAESINYLVKVANDKDLPVLWLDSSDSLKKEKGMNWVPEGSCYNNCELWTNPENKGVIEEMKKLSMKAETSQQNGIFNPILFNYAKALTLFKIYQSQLSKDESLNEQRLQVLNQVEGIMRECLKKCSIIEEFFSLLEELQANELLYKQNEVNDDFKKQKEVSKAKMIEYLRKNGVEEAALKWYEKEESSALKRSFRLQFMCRIRFTLHKIYQSRNLLTNSYFTIKNGLTNIHRYSIGARLCQTGFDPQIKPIVTSSAPVAGKKDDKKGAKKEQQVPQIVPSAAIDATKQKELKDKAENKLYRTSLNGYWHIKLLFQIARLLFKQNSFREAIKVFEILIASCKKYEEEYFMLLSQGFIARCKLRLGYFQPEDFRRVIESLEKMHFYDLNYLALVMDLGELLSGQPEALIYLSKGKQVSEIIWKHYGMKLTLAGIGAKCSLRNYYLKEELLAEQEETIKKRKKGGEKKGGKDEKKGAAKKEDPKKKKEENKLDFKVSPLSKLVEVSLLEEQKFIFGSHVLDPHPNYNKNNIYQQYALIFIKTYLSVLRQEIKLKKLTSKHLQEVNYILNLLEVLDSYPFPIDHVKIGFFACLGKIYKHAFLSELNSIIINSKDHYLSQLKRPFEDLPLNRTLINLPAYSQCLLKNRQLLMKAKSYFKKSLSLIENSALLFERSLTMEEVAWQYADNQCLLAEYIGRDKPKFFPEEQAGLNSEEIKLESLNNIIEAFGFLEFAIKIKSIKFELERNYMEIGGKGLDPAVKIDEDISSQILQIDRQCKRGYPQFLIDSFKGKGPITGMDLITYMLKTHRQAELMTFTNSAYQNTIYKCNRILTKSLAGYKEKCLISSLEVPLRKTLKDKFLEPETFIIKSSRDDLKETFLYILGPLTDSDDVYYGRVHIDLLILSRITEDLLALSTKTSLSDKKSQAVKNRDYLLHRKEFKRILMEISVRFGNLKTEGSIKAIEEEFLVELTGDNLKVLNKMLDSSGATLKSKEMCKFWRKLHQIKYQS